MIVRPWPAQIQDTETNSSRTVDILYRYSINSHVVDWFPGKALRELLCNDTTANTTVSPVSTTSLHFFFFFLNCADRLIHVCCI